MAEEKEVRKNYIVRALIGPKLIMGMDSQVIFPVIMITVALSFAFSTPAFLPVALLILYFLKKAYKNDTQFRSVWLKFRKQNLRYDPFVRAEHITGRFSMFGADKENSKPVGVGRGGI